ncbi:MAG: hypothetical protein WA418_01685 [Bradyrhizobium sp.]
MLARDFTRLTALEAIRPSALLATNGPWPTQAGPYVSDSKIDPIDDVNGDEKRSLIGVYTEGSSLVKVAQNGPVFYKGECDLVFELSVVANYPGANGEVVVDFADTDAAVETMLGVMEEQIIHALHYGPTGKLFRQMVKLPFDEWHSTVKSRSGEEDIRVARRTVRGRIHVRETMYSPAPTTQPVDFDRLPTGLQSIANQLGASTYLHDLALGMARLAPVMPLRVDLNGVGITAKPQPGVNGTVPLQTSANNLQG